MSDKEVLSVPGKEEEIASKQDIKPLEGYWKRNLRYLLVLLIIWALVSYGCGIVFKDLLDNIQIGGFGLGFWFAQQGSIYVFVILIFVYVWLMNRLDRKYDVDEK